VAQLDIAAIDTHMFVVLTVCSFLDRRQVPGSSRVLGAPLLGHPSAWGWLQIPAGT